MPQLLANIHVKALILLDLSSAFQQSQSRVQPVLSRCISCISSSYVCVERCYRL